MTPTADEIERAIKATEYKYFGDYEMSDDQRESVDVLVAAARAAIQAMNQRGEPVAWMYTSGESCHVSLLPVISKRDAFWGWTETPLYR